MAKRYSNHPNVVQIGSIDNINIWFITAVCVVQNMLIVNYCHRITAYSILVILKEEKASFTFPPFGLVKNYESLGLTLFISLVIHLLTRMDFRIYYIYA